MLVDTEYGNVHLLVNGSIDAGANVDPVSQLLLDARRALPSDVDAALRCIERAAALLKKPVAQSRETAVKGGLAVWQIDRIKRHIDAKLDEPVTVVQLARIVRLSAAYFSNAFKASFGLRPHAYILSRRVSRAMELMISSDLPLGSIALDCGFSDQAHFSRRFRQATGASPNIWRRNHRRVSDVPRKHAA